MVPDIVSQEDTLSCLEIYTGINKEKTGNSLNSHASTLALLLFLFDIITHAFNILNYSSPSFCFKSFPFLTTLFFHLSLLLISLPDSLNMAWFCDMFYFNQGILTFYSCSMSYSAFFPPNVIQSTICAGNKETQSKCTSHTKASMYFKIRLQNSPPSALSPTSSSEYKHTSTNTKLINIH